jgi:hypothetical protein
VIVDDVLDSVILNVDKGRYEPRPIKSISRIMSEVPGGNPMLISREVPGIVITISTGMGCVTNTPIARLTAERGARIQLPQQLV